MKREDIDHLLDIMAVEAAEKGDESLRPGAITFNSSTWVKRSSADLPTTCVNTTIGIRYRGVQVLISSRREDKVLNRAEDGGAGEPYMELEPKS
ncbi:hypothetical protein [Caulobacter sp. Root1472]|uniref:hypothetical protein n=1 Tax=Caulobacter sp. Root1472 TaxID=1736470 RepID=UPI0006F9771E|nr:hypothetical protein [Caulobacter sp. Root1472]KQZ29030.1 hypothetical protein ASD47_20085 [Caulobacter sp. Root1472]